MWRLIHFEQRIPTAMVWPCAQNVPRQVGEASPTGHTHRKATQKVAWLYSRSGLAPPWCGSCRTFRGCWNVEGISRPPMAAALVTLLRGKVSVEVNEYIVSTSFIGRPTAVSVPSANSATKWQPTTCSLPQFHLWLHSNHIFIMFPLGFVLLLSQLSEKYTRRNAETFVLTKQLRCVQLKRDLRVCTYHIPHITKFQQRFSRIYALWENMLLRTRRSGFVQSQIFQAFFTNASGKVWRTLKTFFVRRFFRWGNVCGCALTATERSRWVASARVRKKICRDGRSSNFRQGWKRHRCIKLFYATYRWVQV